MPKRVLVVDDSKTIREQVRRALEVGGYEVIEAVDGQDGYQKIRANIDLAMVFCDVNMPNMTGIGMLEALRSDGGVGLPIVMLTTEGQPTLIQRAKQAGAKGWIVKPFKPEHLLAAVTKLCG
jgi:two-component system chemotaxis response regulator CheY